jgi:glycyl-tRNA synthetase beta chain
MEQLNFSWPHTDAENQFWSFMADRLRHLMQLRGLQYEEIAAVTSDIERIATHSVRTLVDYAAEVAAVRSMPEFGALAEAFKRANNIVEEAWAGEVSIRSSGVNTERLHEGAEVALRGSLERIGVEMRSHLDALNPRAALLAVAPIRSDLDRFFSEVRVNVDDEGLREARLALLAQLRSLILEIGDLSYIAPKRPA